MPRKRSTESMRLLAGSTGNCARSVAGRGIGTTFRCGWGLAAMGEAFFVPFRG
jgi:hypothetical protein